MYVGDLSNDEYRCIHARSDLLDCDRKYWPKETVYEPSYTICPACPTCQPTHNGIAALFFITTVLFLILFLCVNEGYNRLDAQMKQTPVVQLHTPVMTGEK